MLTLIRLLDAARILKALARTRPSRPHRWCPLGAAIFAPGNEVHLLVAGSLPSGA